MGSPKPDSSSRSDPLAIWQSAAHGDQAAIAEIVGLAQAAAQRVLRRYRLSAEEVTELTQETVVSVLRAVKSCLCSPKTNMEAFLGFRALAVWKERNRRRRREREARVDFGDALLELPVDRAQPFESLELGEVRSALAVCMNRLTDNERRAWSDRLERGMLPTETASELGVSATLVRVWILRGGQKLRSCLCSKLQIETEQ